MQGQSFLTEIALSVVRLRDDKHVARKTAWFMDHRIRLANGLENFWSLLMRTVSGTYVAVEPFPLHRYPDEYMFRYNKRATKQNPLNDSDRFDLAARQIVGKRVTYRELTGKTSETAF